MYATLGVTWILVSDKLVAAMSSDIQWLVDAHHYKGIFYIIATSLGLVFVFNANCQRLLHARNRTEATELQVRDLFAQHPKPMWV